MQDYIPPIEDYRFLLGEALDALKAGRKPAMERFEPIGCKIDPL